MAKTWGEEEKKIEELEDGGAFVKMVRGECDVEIEEWNKVSWDLPPRE